MSEDVHIGEPGFSSAHGASGDMAVELTVEQKIRAKLNDVGAPTHNEERELTQDERLAQLLVRLGDRMEGIVQANIVLLETLQEVRTLLVGSPNASQFRVKKAITLITATITPRGTILRPD